MLYAARMSEHTEQQRMPGEIREEDIPGEVLFHGPNHDDLRVVVLDRVFLPPEVCMRTQPYAEYQHYARRSDDFFERGYDWIAACRDVETCLDRSVREAVGNGLVDGGTFIFGPESR